MGIDNKTILPLDDIEFQFVFQMFPSQWNTIKKEKNGSQLQILSRIGQFETFFFG